MATRSAIIIDYSKIENTKYPARGTYCHYDGYLEGVGKILYDHYTKLPAVEELISEGEIRSIESTFEETETYFRLSGKTDQSYYPLDGDSVDDVEQRIGHDGHVYVFDASTETWYHNGKLLSVCLEEVIY